MAGGGLLRRLYHSNPVARAVLAGPAAIRRRMIGDRVQPVLDVVARCAERIEGDVLLNMPEFEGKFRCSARSDLFRRVVIHANYEAELVALFRQYLDPQRDVLDIGANIGFFSVLSAKLLDSGKVLALEPTNAAHARLMANLENNGVLDKVTVFKGAGGSEPGEAMIHQIEGMEEYSSLGEIKHHSATGKHSIAQPTPVETIDRLVEQHGLNPGLVKIDVEGAEGMVLSGAKGMLEKYRPVVISEMSRALLEPMGSSPEEIIALFEGLGYAVSDPLNPGIKPGTTDYGDILCLPQ